MTADAAATPAASTPAASTPAASTPAAASDALAADPLAEDLRALQDKAARIAQALAALSRQVDDLQQQITIHQQRPGI